MCAREEGIAQALHRDAVNGGSLRVQARPGHSRQWAHLEQSHLLVRLFTHDEIDPERNRDSREGQMSKNGHFLHPRCGSHR